MIFVDLCLGPCVTLIVSNPKKRRSELLRDWAVIAVLQLVALVYGAYTLWGGRPIALVLAVDRIEVVTANMYLPQHLSLAKERCSKDSDSTFLPKWSACWSVAKMPSNVEERNAILFSALGGGGDLASMPKYYVPAAKAEAEFLAIQKSISDARNKWRPVATALNASIARSGLAEDDLGVIWVSGRSKSALLLVKRLNGSVLDTLISNEL